MKQANINILAIAQGCSEYNVSVVLKREDSIKALRAVHSRFYNSETTIAMGIIGPGLIGSTLLDQLRDQVLLGYGFLFLVARSKVSCLCRDSTSITAS